MMKAVFEDSTIFETIVSSIKDSFTDVNISFTKERIHFTCPDTSHVSMCSLNIDAKDLKEYDCKHTIVCGVKMELLHKFLSCGNKDSSLTLSYSEKENRDNLILEFYNETHNSRFEMKLIDLETEELNIPEIKYDSIFVMPSSEFLTKCKNLSNIGDTVCLKTTKNAFHFIVSGDSGKADITVKPPKIVEIINEKGEKVKPKVSMRLTVRATASVDVSLPRLKEHAKCTTISKYVKICMTNDIPIFLKYCFLKSSFLGFYIAPKFDQQEE